MPTARMQQLLDNMNKHAIYNDYCEPSFAIVADDEGNDTDNDFGYQDDMFITELLTTSKSFNGNEVTVLLCDMPLGMCHLNVIDAAQEGETIYTGYAQVAYPDGSGGDWFPHSWLMSIDGELVETFDHHFPCYYGFPVMGEQLTRFTNFVNSTMRSNG
ncbi:hypothetical protein LMH73_004810 [Vibrio splendidus]|nr:hypothetical protein [Vibrio splendidus]MCC4882550.1 hypothetical protein [Vibrio splendidus]